MEPAPRLAVSVVAAKVIIPLGLILQLSVVIEPSTPTPFNAIDAVATDIELVTLFVMYELVAAVNVSTSV